MWMRFDSTSNVLNKSKIVILALRLVIPKNGHKLVHHPTEPQNSLSKQINEN